MPVPKGAKLRWNPTQEATQMLTICMGGWMRVQLLDWNVWENMSHKETNGALGVKFDIQTTNKPFYNTTCLRESGNSAINCIVCLLDACKVFAHISSKLWQVKKKKQFQHEKSCSSPWQGVYIHCWADMANLDLLQDWKGKFHKNKRTMFYFFLTIMIIQRRKSSVQTYC